MEDTTGKKTEASSTRMGPLSAVIVIVLLLAIGGIYYLVTQEQHLRALHASEQFNS